MINIGDIIDVECRLYDIVKENMSEVDFYKHPVFKSWELLNEYLIEEKNKSYFDRAYSLYEWSKK